jgi:amino acid transporter
MNFIKNIIWFIATILPLTIWFLLYKAYNSDYDDNVTFLIQSILLSFLTIVILVFLYRIDRERFKKLKWLNTYIIMLGSPLTYFFAWAYMTFIPMSWQWTQDISKKDEKYSLSKYQNFFKTKYVYHDGQFNSDTLIITVTRNDNVQSILILKDGQEMETSIDKLQNRDKLSKLGLFKYDKP